LRWQTQQLGRPDSRKTSNRVLDVVVVQAAGLAYKHQDRAAMIANRQAGESVRLQIQRRHEGGPNDKHRLQSQRDDECGSGKCDGKAEFAEVAKHEGAGCFRAHTLGDEECTTERLLTVFMRHQGPTSSGSQSGPPALYSGPQSSTLPRGTSTSSNDMGT